MTPREASEILHLWLAWNPGRVLDNHAYSDFVFDVVHRHTALEQVGVFEVLDVAVNAEAWAAYGKVPASAAGTAASKPAEDSTRGEASATGVVEVE